MKLALAAITLALALPAAQAAVINIDLSSAVSGTLVTGVGATFAQRFDGQTVVGTGITGSPSNPLTLSAAGTIAVASFNPGVSATSNSLLSQPGNAAPLSILLGGSADSFAWTMGSSSFGSVVADLFSETGALVASQVVAMGNGYNLYSLTGLGNFRGITFRDNNDDSGVRFQNMSYNTVSTEVPEPGTMALMGLSLLAVALAGRRRAPKLSSTLQP